MEQQVESYDATSKIRSKSIDVGTPVKTKFMKQFITQIKDKDSYKFDLEIILARIAVAAKFINRVGAENVLICSSQSKALMPIERFCELTGAKAKTGRFMPGTLTNPSLKDYTEPKLVLVSNPQIDGQAVIEATNAGIPVIGIANTDNITSKIDLVIPANNQGSVQLATIYWLLARHILVDSGKIKEDGDMQYDIDDFETKSLEEA